MNIEKYIENLIELLIQRFGQRLLYVGLQGSYSRAEATSDSDIDIMVVIDNLSISDLDCYRNAIQTLPHYDKSCGFICSKTDLINWNPLELCHLLHTTNDYYGTLCNMIPEYSRHDVLNFIKMSVNNLYHEICHRYIHCRDMHDIQHLTGAYKGVFFILQNLYYLTHGHFVSTKAELLEYLDGKNRTVLQRSLELNSGMVCELSESFELLFIWCQETLQNISTI